VLEELMVIWHLDYFESETDTSRNWLVLTDFPDTAQRHVVLLDQVEEVAGAILIG
jgi:hypothetical protein